MIVMKFGGTSVESAAAIERVAGIVRTRESHRPVVVVSAMGKTTNKLLAIAAAAIDGRRADYIQQIHDLRDLHSREARLVVPLAERAELDRMLDEHFQELMELVKGLGWAERTVASACRRTMRCPGTRNVWKYGLGPRMAYSDRME